MNSFPSVRWLGVVSTLTFFILFMQVGAVITVTWIEESTGVRANYSGSIDVQSFGILSFSEVQSERAIRNNQAFAYYDGGNLDRYIDVGTPSIISPVNLPNGTGVGDSFAFAVNDIFVTSGYVSGSPLAGSAFFAGQTLASVFPSDLPDLIGKSTEVWRSNNDNETIVYNVIPEPKSAFSILIILSIIPFLRRRN